jgi:hypothetical protein
MIRHNRRRRRCLNLEFVPFFVPCLFLSFPSPSTLLHALTVNFAPVVIRTYASTDRRLPGYTRPATEYAVRSESTDA